jgi:hypothetical protein
LVVQIGSGKQTGIRQRNPRKESTMLQNEARSLKGLEIGTLDASEIGEALGVISRGMRDNPIHVAAFGEDSERRVQRLHRLFEGVFAALPTARHKIGRAHV